MFTKAFRIGNAPELRYTQKGDAVLSLSLAYNYGMKQQDGKKPTQWLEAALWGKHAESLAPYLQKGGQIVATVDDLHIETYEGKNGPGHKLAGRIVSLELVGGPTKEQEQNRQAAREISKAGGLRAGSGHFDDMSDDVPF